jgi:hypothetical protein
MPEYRIGLADAMTKLEWSNHTTDIRYLSADQLSLIAARNETVGFQVLVRSDAEFTLTLNRANWIAPLGHCPRLRLEVSFPGLPEGAIEAFPVGYLEDDDRRWRAEYFDHADHVSVPAGRPQAVYVRINIPRGIKPGNYEGQVKAYTQYGFEDEKPAWTGSVALEMADVTLPDPKEWDFHLDLWQHATSVALHHHTPLWSDAHFEILERYFASLAKLGQKAVTVIATEMPWSGQKCFRDAYYPSYIYEHAIVEVHRDKQSQLRLNTDKLERLLQLAARYGLDREIEVFGLLNIWVDEEYGFGKVIADAPDSIRVRCYDERSGAITYLRTAAELHTFIRLLADYFKRTGRIERVRIAADEPADVPLFTERLRFIKAAAPEFLFKVAINHFEFMAEADPELVDWVPNLTNACRDPQLTARLTEELHRKGGKMCWYICCGPAFPNTFLRSPLVEGRLLGWMTYRLRLDGFLRWAFCLWPAKPYERLSWRAPFWNAGDMNFVLPGADGYPVETLRYEALRVGIQEYALLKLAEKRLSKAAMADLTAQIWKKLLHTDNVGDFARVNQLQPTDLYSLDPADYAAARKLVIEALAQAKGR